MEVPVIGRTVSHYRILERLGEGGMGVVYKAEDTKLGRTVALKFLASDLTGDRDHRERFLREARVVSTLEHQNICTIHEIDETDDGQVFISMACYGGHTLKDIIRSGPVEPGDAIRFGLQIARGLSVAHAAGIIHRDVKPGNVMVSPHGHVRLVDFGLAKLAGQSSLTRTGHAVGTVAYMSPEQTRGEPADERTDIWALGVILYEMVAGRRPFTGDSNREVMRAIQRERPVPLSEAAPDSPPQLSEIVSRALEKKAGGRYAKMDDMLSDLRELALQLELNDESRTASWRYAQARERRLRVTAAISVAAVVALVTVWWTSRLTAERPIPMGIPMQVTSGEAWEGEPAISPDGTRVAYVSDVSGNSEIYVSDVAGPGQLQLTSDPGMDFAPAWFADGAALAFVSDRGGRRDVWQVGQFGGGATLLAENAEYPALSPDGTRMAFSRPDDSGELRIWVAPLDRPESARMLTTADYGLWDHVGAAWSPDSKSISYFSFSCLWVVSANGGIPRRVTEEGWNGSDTAWSSDGRYIYFDCYEEGTLAIWRVPADGGAPQRMTEGTGSESEPSVCRDGSRFAHSTGSPGAEGVLVDRGTGSQTTLGRMRFVFLASLSPDGSRIVFVSRRWDRRGELAEVLLDDGVPAGPPRRLTDQEGTASHPSYSPDGRWIAYYLIKDDKRDIWVIPAHGGTPLQFTDGHGQDFHPAWSPDSDMLAYVSREEGTTRLFVAPIRGGMRAGDARMITDGRITVASPAWSPDGSRIAFLGTSDDTLSIWLAPSDGSGPPRRLTDGVDASTIRWDRASGRILASATMGEGRRSLWAVSPETGEVLPFEPEVVFGTERAVGLFGLSRDGHLLVFLRESLAGDIWVSEGPQHLF
jgi:Tol biopolymer transport system component